MLVTEKNCYFNLPLIEMTIIVLNILLPLITRNNKNKTFFEVFQFKSNALSTLQLLLVAKGEISY